MSSVQPPNHPNGPQTCDGSGNAPHEEVEPGDEGRPERDRVPPLLTRILRRLRDRRTPQRRR